MKKPSFRFALLLLAVAPSLGAQTGDTTKLKSSYHEVNFFVEDNENQCLYCHGEAYYILEDTLMGRTIRQSMCEDRRIDRDLYYTSVHKSFSCTDCHSWDYNIFPHPLETRLETQLVCMDCHGYDETYAQYHFEEIDMEFQESIHNMEEFTCWKCHDPHSYRAFMRNSDDFAEAIVYDNNMCLSCHANYERFGLLSEREEINVIESHDWLPNQAAHFANVRCIECHTEINDSILIAHKIMPKENAVKLCTECHSTDSRLMHSLYKFQSRQERQGGFLNGVILNNSYVIGANRNIFLDRLSYLLIAATLAGMGVHIILRIRKSKSN